MELDRQVSDYMQKRNILATKVAGILSAQLLLVAVFFCALNLINDDHVLRRVVIIATIVISVMIAVSGIMIVYRNRNISNSIPDDIGLRQSRDIIEYAYSIARDALIFRMTVAGIVLSLSIIIALFFSKIFFYLGLAAAVFLMLPSFDRNLSYKEMMSRHVTKVVSIPFMENSISGVLFFVLMPLSTCLYLLWRYFGTVQSDIAWIVFCMAGIIYGAVMVLCGRSSGLE